MLCVHLWNEYPSDATIHSEAFKGFTVIHNGNSLCYRHLKLVRRENPKDVFTISDTKLRDAIRHLG